MAVKSNDWCSLLVHFHYWMDVTSQGKVQWGKNSQKMSNTLASDSDWLRWKCKQSNATNRITFSERLVFFLFTFSALSSFTMLDILFEQIRQVFYSRDYREMMQWDNSPQDLGIWLESWTTSWSWGSLFPPGEGSTSAASQGLWACPCWLEPAWRAPPAALLPWACRLSGERRGARPASRTPSKWEGTWRSWRAELPRPRSEGGSFVSLACVAAGAAAVAGGTCKMDVSKLTLLVQFFLSFWGEKPQQ